MSRASFPFYCHRDPLLKFRTVQVVFLGTEAKRAFNSRFSHFLWIIWVLGFFTFRNRIFAPVKIEGTQVHHSCNYSCNAT